MPDEQEDFRKMDYLGGGVYAIYDDFGIWLHANDHKHPTDKIYLESSVLKALNSFAVRMQKLRKEDKKRKMKKDLTND